MLYNFSKYSGSGNDFILYDNRALTFPLDERELIAQLCHRQKGIGADGIILLENSQKAHFKMRIFNSDGSEAEMCGNGIRCLLKFIQSLGISGDLFNIETKLNVLKTAALGNEVAVEMGNFHEMQWNVPIEPWNVHYIDTGVPHAVVFSDLIDVLNLHDLAPKIRFHPTFAPRGTNVNFAQVHQDGFVHVRTYERGVEQETLACGTGVTAVALAAVKMYELKSPVITKVRSGEILQVDFEFQNNHFTNVRLIGPAQHIFDGSILI